MENPDVFMNLYGLKFLLLKLMTYIATSRVFPLNLEDIYRCKQKQTRNVDFEGFI